MPVIQRALTREILLSFAAVLLILLLIGISNQFVIYLADAASGDISAGLVLKIVGMHLPSLAGVLLPLAIFLGVMLALSRWYTDTELPALFACGFTQRQLVRVVLWPAGVVMALAFLINLWLAPHYLYKVANVLANAQTDLITRAVKPGRFQVSDDGRFVLYINRVSDDAKEAYDIFIAEQDPQGEGFHLGVIASPRAIHAYQPDFDDEYIVLKDGHRYQGRPGEKNYELMSFTEYGLRLLTPEPKLRIKERAMPSTQLWNSTDREEQAELQWRVCLSLSALVLPLWAVWVAKVKPRQGRYARAFPAILIAVVYINGLIFARSIYESTQLPAWLGLYWMPLAAAVGALVLLNQQNRFRRWLW